MPHDPPGAPDQADVAAGLQSLRRIAAALGLRVGTFFGGADVDGGDEPRSREAQAEALRDAFERIVDPRSRELLVALVEAEAARTVRPR